MHLRRLFTALLILPFLATWALADRSMGHRAALFDGKSLFGWHVTGCEVEVKDGLLLCKSGDGLVRTDHRYGDCILEIEWKAEKSSGYDSGIYVRAELPAKGKPWPSLYQLNLKEGLEGNLVRVDGGTSTGLIKKGDWNHFKITVIGDTIAMEINGKKAWKTSGVKNPTGYIGLQVEATQGGAFAFRNISVTELSHRSMFNGKDLTGWEGASGDASQCWEVVDGTIFCTKSKGPWLRSLQQVDDFNMRLEYKVNEGGNSGVFVRVPKSGKHHGKDTGIEIQVLDDKAKKHSKLKGYQYSGGVYDFAPVTQKVGRDPGEWNSMEINCKGHAYRITHNGIVIVDVSEKDYPKLTERLTKGFLGLQNHGGGVWFRNLRLGPAM